MTAQTSCLTTIDELPDHHRRLAVSDWFLVMTIAIALDQLLLVATGRCPASLVVDRLPARRS